MKIQLTKQQKDAVLSALTNEIIHLGDYGDKDSNRQAKVLSNAYRKLVKVI